ncbi:MAG: hypothetical protein M5U12_05320 [Verrucomicrobia bacterium]|nr:hypothetical protein [Verrucomicrobiota bacterium]
MGVDRLLEVVRLGQRQHRFAQTKRLPHELIARRADQGATARQIFQKPRLAYGAERQVPTTRMVTTPVHAHVQARAGEDLEHRFRHRPTPVRHEMFARARRRGRHFRS